MQLLPWPDYSSNMLSIEHVWDFMGRRLARDPCPARVPLYRDLLTANHRRLQWAHQHRAWQADWHQVVFSDESRFNFWDHDGRIRVMPVNAAFQRALSNDIEA
ncbi:transposable element Tcb1 transposase [Trichonephila clavipes]|nr:transposable element Tcb1 transposase [Trichonephila clavipes]